MLKSLFQPQSGVVLGNTGGPVTFAEGQTSVRVSIPIEGNGFLAVDTTFTATLRTVDYLGQGGNSMFVSYTYQCST